MLQQQDGQSTVLQYITIYCSVYCESIAVVIVVVTAVFVAVSTAVLPLLCVELSGSAACLWERNVMICDGSIRTGRVQRNCDCIRLSLQYLHVLVHE